MSGPLSGWRPGLKDCGRPRCRDIASLAESRTQSCLIRGWRVVAEDEGVTDAAQREPDGLALASGADASVPAHFTEAALAGADIYAGGFWGPDGHQMEHAVGTGAEVITVVLRRVALRKFR